MTGTSIDYLVDKRLNCYSLVRMSEKSPINFTSKKTSKRKIFGVITALKTLHSIVQGNDYNSIIYCRENIRIIANYASKGNWHQQILGECGCCRVLVLILDRIRFINDSRTAGDLLCAMYWLFRVDPDSTSSFQISKRNVAIAIQNGLLKVLDTVMVQFYECPRVIVISCEILLLIFAPKTDQFKSEQLSSNNFIQLLCNCMVRYENSPDIIELLIMTIFNIIQYIHAFTSHLSMARLLLSLPLMRDTYIVKSGLFLLYRKKYHCIEHCTEYNMQELVQLIMHQIHLHIDSKTILYMATRAIQSLIELYPIIARQVLLDLGFCDIAIHICINHKLHNNRPLLMITLLKTIISIPYLSTYDLAYLKRNGLINNMTNEINPNYVLINEVWKPFLLLLSNDLKWERRRQFCLFLSGCHLLCKPYKILPSLQLLLFPYLKFDNNLNKKISAKENVFFSLSFCRIIASYL